MADIKTCRISTSWGAIEVHAAGGGVIDCTLPRLAATPEIPFAVLKAGNDLFSRYIRDLLEGRTPPMPPVGALAGTSFQSKVWRGLLSIPRGETRSYGDVAKLVGHPKACRAVANACGKNPVPLFIPCHRVVHSDGSLGGFSSGIAWKKLLIGLEHGKHF